MRSSKSIEMIEIVAGGLGELLDEVVFVGGAVTSLYIDDPAALYIRPTKDVDCIIELSGKQAFNKLEEKLRTKGFRNSTDNEDPICRWTYKDILVDVMPTDKSILGFANEWYKEGIDHLIKSTLPNNMEISLLYLPYFIATKIEAFHGRDEKDFRISHDIEDIVIVLDGILNFDKFYDAPATIKNYLSEQFGEFIKDRSFIESLSSHIEHGQSPARTKRIMDFINDYSQIKS
jgi:hypothetical protein